MVLVVLMLMPHASCFMLHALALSYIEFSRSSLSLGARLGLRLPRPSHWVLFCACGYYCCFLPMIMHIHAVEFSL
ncbi:hypothetical protein DFP73DRAFT_543491 [Morchella snyderi]|nr:hypothetical protein DFP73DRAFT_543491 [Morchella snyderi]